ncbi:SDR family oxidoreductase [Affinibrenneria salicis]|uniref:SDR family oxidoreductase n=1 Tax=Affinibrenneria salicis TaxID=2590031 RepID=A0A5J5G1M7_9GAMM|nr:NAD(P)-binding oxidoreductase [Affinibrenneria salicis]KAA9000624.1 SDR family oxidoreductase [Affinibrenneria salicis]
MSECWLLFGAGRGTGAQLLALAQAQRQPVVLVLRDAQQAQQWRGRPDVAVIQGDACDPDCVQLACRTAGPQAIAVSTLGGGDADYRAHRLIIDSAQQNGMRRMLLVTSIGCGDSWPMLSPRARAAFGHAVREKSLAESWLQTSELDYCIVRPGGLTNGPASGNVLLSRRNDLHGLVSRADVALTLAQLLRQTAFGHQIYSLIDPALKLPARG